MVLELRALQIRSTLARDADRCYLKRGYRPLTDPSTHYFARANPEIKSE